MFEIGKKVVALVVDDDERREVLDVDLAESPAKRGEVVVTLEGIDAETAEVSLLHDEDGDYKMKTGERGPAEGYAAKKRALPAERNAVTIRLRYPAAE